MKFILHNGHLLPSDSLLFSAQHRAFRYGDSFFESIRMKDAKPLFAESHYLRLVKTMASLKMIKPEFFTLEYFVSSLSKLAAENGIKNGGRARLVFYREGSGFYKPDVNSVSWIAEAEAITENEYTLNETGINIGIFREIKKSFSPLSQLKTGNSLLYVLASEFTRENNWDDCLLLNDAGCLAEGSNANIFIVINNILYTPPLSEACLDGVMRNVIISLAQKNGIEIKETIMEENILLLADEVWLSNVSRGIRWAAGFVRSNESLWDKDSLGEEKIYGNNMAKKFVDLINNS